MKITKRELKQMVNDSVYDALNESFRDDSGTLYNHEWDKRSFLKHINDMYKLIEKVDNPNLKKNLKFGLGLLKSRFEDYSSKRDFQVKHNFQEIEDEWSKESIERSRIDPSLSVRKLR